MVIRESELQSKDVDEWYEAMREVLKDGSTINFNRIPDDVDLVMNSIRYPPHTGRNLPPAHNPNSRCTTPPMESKMEDIKTVTHEGQVYEIDQEYFFSNDGTHLVYGRLKAICPKSSYPFEAHDGSLCKYIGLIQDCKNMGTITPAPVPLVPLVHGKAYTFDYGDWKNVIGVYSKAGEFLGFSEHCNIHRSIDCTNIRPMAVVQGVKS